MDRLERRAREAMASLGERRPRQRIPDAVRTVVLEFACARRAEGASWAGIAKILGLSTSALMRWSAPSRQRSGRVVPVEVIEERAGDTNTSGLVLVSGRFRIEGLNVTAASELLRRLA